jgi:primosomal protein N' (replication factor Y)
MSATAPIARVAVPGPLHELFDYRLPAGAAPAPGTRVRVPFGRGHRIGVVIECADHSDIPQARLRDIDSLLDDAPLFPGELLEFIVWASRYYHHPLGDCLETAMPALLRQGRPARPARERQWRLTDEGRDTDANEILRRAPRQAALLVRLQRYGEVSARNFPDWEGDWRGGLARLVDKGLAHTEDSPAFGLVQGRGDEPAPTLNPDQQRVVEAVAGAPGFEALLVEGVTGSGKTAVYLEAIEAVVRRGQQALVIVPEIGLTPQLLDRFAARLAAPIAVLHSGLSDGERLGAWLAARAGEAAVVLGTRSAVFTPLARPGLVVVDEEHDASLKQQDGFRYSARDLALARAKRLDIPVLLGSATPSLESLHNAGQGRYRHLQLPNRATGAPMPRFRLLDVRGRPMSEGLSEPLLDHVGRHLEAGGQVLLFLNRRGYAPVLLCHECGWLAECERCDARLTYHHGRGHLRCHHCDYQRRVDAACPHCGSADLRPLGLGTERVEAALEAAFPDTSLVRIDRDSTRRRGEFERRMGAARDGAARLLLGTQMLAKGHHLPDVTLVGIIDADQGLFGADFRAAERLAQLIVQVAGRAGRAERPGEVAIQTHYPEHPLLQTLIRDGYPAFAAAALAERIAAGMPPARHLALLRAEAVDRDTPRRFLEQARSLSESNGACGVERLGPVPAPMERRAGRYRAQLLLQSEHRASLHALLARWVPGLRHLPLARKVRWSLDVDPAETL